MQTPDRGPGRVRGNAPAPVGGGWGEGWVPLFCLWSAPASGLGCCPPTRGGQSALLGPLPTFPADPLTDTPTGKDQHGHLGARPLTAKSPPQVAYLGLQLIMPCLWVSFLKRRIGAIIVKFILNLM